MKEIARLRFNIFTADQALPVKYATVFVTNANTNESYNLITNENGDTDDLIVTAPDVSTTFDPYYSGTPYSVFNAVIKAEGYTPVKINGIQVFANETAIQPVEMVPRPVNARFSDVADVYNIPPNALKLTYPNYQEYNNYSPRVLKEPIIPEYITVHLGRPDNSSARNVTVPFTDYIKNVASSEIYPTWPENSLRANIYAQISIALNRIYTEWYRSRGYSFDITNSTSYDQYFVYGRNIFENISRIVDEIFNTYIRKQGTINPYYAEYCNGTTVTCKGMSQWGTVSLAENGYTPLEILRYYYGNNVELHTTNNIQSIQSSYPGTPLKLGTVSDAVITISNQLNRIRKNYPAVPEIKNVSSTYTTEVQDAVKAFQKIFNLSTDGIVGPATWNKISYIYVSVKKLAELSSEGETTVLPDTPPCNTIKLYSTGDYVKLAQYFLSVISNYNFNVSPVSIDGIFGPKTQESVINFQKAYGLNPDGIIGCKTWNALYSVYMGIAKTTGLALKYPGHLLKVGSRGANVELIQNYLNTISDHQPSISKVAADGIFGEKTKNAVIQFQKIYNLEPDGIVGEKTWNKIIAVRLLY